MHCMFSEFLVYDSRRDDAFHSFFIVTFSYFPSTL